MQMNILERLKSAKWKKIDGFPHEVSSCGMVRNETTKKVLRLSDTITGYKKVCLSAGQPKHFRVHRLVVEGWIGPIMDGMVVNHKDGNKANNHVTNLEIVTHSENMKHAVAHALTASGDKNGMRKYPEKVLRGLDHPSAKLSDADVEQIIQLRNQGVKLKTIAAAWGVSESLVCGFARGRHRPRVTSVCTAVDEKDRS